MKLDIWYTYQPEEVEKDLVAWENEREIDLRVWENQLNLQQKKQFVSFGKLTNLDLDQEEKEDKEEPRSADVLMILKRLNKKGWTRKIPIIRIFQKPLR